NDWEFVPVTLINTNSTLDEVVVTRRRERASEIALLEERKLSNLMVEKIGAQELSRKGVSDAASALAKMSGVSRVEGTSQEYVRGLGDRYKIGRASCRERVSIEVVDDRPYEELENVDRHAERDQEGHEQVEVR